jgi:hypothetical protein
MTNFATNAFAPSTIAMFALPRRTARAPARGAR